MPKVKDIINWKDNLIYNCLAFADKKEKKSFFSEVIGSISDVKFSPDGRYIMARDYLKLKIWDVNMDGILYYYNVVSNIN